MAEFAIKVENVRKSFRLPHEKTSSIKSAVINFYRRNKSFEKQLVLDNVSFEVKKGEFFGIVGRNGSGKSTLLKLLAGIYAPDSGSININGKLTPFIELGVGFNHELTGRENVYLNGALLGFNHTEMDKMYADIVAFAELGKFMDQKLKNYSSGMQVRLAFSIAIRTNSEILIMDEVLAVGDAAFQKKCFDIFRELKNEGRTIILVTHDMASVERFCDRALVLQDSKVVNIGSAKDTAALYSRLNIKDAAVDEDDHSGLKKRKKNRWGTGGIKVRNITLSDNTGLKTNVFETGGSIKIDLEIVREKEFKKTRFVCGLALYNQDGINVCGPNSINQELKPDATAVTVTLPSINFAPGEYSLTVAIYNNEVTEPFDFLDRYKKLSILSDHTVHGLIEIPSLWEST